jgi:hypothetical protein
MHLVLAWTPDTKEENKFGLFGLRLRLKSSWAELGNLHLA